MKLKSFTFDIDDAAATGLADGASSAGTSVTLNGSLISGGTYTAGDSMGHIIVITDAGGHNQATATYTLTGTNANNETISEAITGPGISSTVVSTKFYKSISSVAIATPTAASTVNIGTRGTTLSARSKVIDLDPYSQIGATIAIKQTGTANWDVLVTYSDISSGSTPWGSANFVAGPSGLTAKTAGAEAVLITGAKGLLVEINTFTDSAELTVDVIQPRH